MERRDRTFKIPDHPIDSKIVTASREHAMQMEGTLLTLIAAGTAFAATTALISRRLFIQRESKPQRS